jgi:DNA-binding NtrC family response regulator
VGLWWPSSTKPAAVLGVTSPTVRKLRSELPEALQRALGRATTEPLATSGRPLDLLVVEDDRALAQAMARLLQTSAERRLGRELRIHLAHSGDDGRRRVLDVGPPDLLWVDMQLETPRAGIELVRWLRAQRAPSVVLGKTSRAPPEDVRELTRLGALSVYAPSRPREVHSLLADALRVADEGAIIRQLEETVDGLEEGILQRVTRAATAVEAIERVRHVRRIVEGLEVDLSTLLPEGVGDSEHTLEEVRSGAARLALAAAHGNVSEAARILGVSSRRVLSMTNRTRAGGRKQTPQE